MAKRYLDEEGLQAYDNMIKDVIALSTDKIVVSKQNYLLFPSIGDTKSVYIDIDNNSVYRWDKNRMKYYCIGRNYKDIDVISGGTSQNN